MKKWLLILLLALTGGCGDPVEPIQPDPPDPAEPIPEIIAFTYLHNGSMANDCYEYTAEKTEDGTQLHLEGLFSGGWLVEEITQDPVLKELRETAETWGLLSWDGFNEVNSMILDGEGFSLSMTLSDGRTVSAHGSNAFPMNYSEAEAEIHAIFAPYLPSEEALY